MTISLLLNFGVQAVADGLAVIAGGAVMHCSAQGSASVGKHVASVCKPCPDTLYLYLPQADGIVPTAPEHGKVS
jgi:hypothetical protein